MMPKSPRGSPKKKLQLSKLRSTVEDYLGLDAKLLLDDHDRIRALESVSKLLAKYILSAQKTSARPQYRSVLDDDRKKSLAGAVDTHTWLRPLCPRLITNLKKTIESFDEYRREALLSIVELTIQCLRTIPDARWMSESPACRNAEEATCMLTLVSEIALHVFEMVNSYSVHRNLLTAVVQGTRSQSIMFLQLFDHECHKELICKCYIRCGRLPTLIEQTLLDLGSKHDREGLSRLILEIANLLYDQTAICVPMVKALKRLYPWCADTSDIVHLNLPVYLAFVCPRKTRREDSDDDEDLSNERDAVRLKAFSALTRMEYKIKRGVVPFVLTLLLKVAIEGQKDSVFEQDARFLGACQLMFTSEEPVSGRIGIQILAVLSGSGIYPPFEDTITEFYSHAEEMHFTERETLNVTYFYLNLMMDEKRQANEIAETMANILKENNDFSKRVRGGILYAWQDLLMLSGPKSRSLLLPHKHVIRQLMSSPLLGRELRDLTNNLIQLLDGNRFKNFVKSSEKPKSTRVSSATEWSRKYSDKYTNILDEEPNQNQQRSSSFSDFSEEESALIPGRSTSDDGPYRQQVRPIFTRGGGRPHVQDSQSCSIL